MAKQLWIKGIVPAVFTPQHTEGGLNLEMVPALVERLRAQGAAALYVCGSTGEGPSLAAEERMAVAEAYVDAVAGRVPVIVQVGHNSLWEARRLAAHAQSVGANAISAVPPSYFPIGSLDTLLACLAEITAGAPELPFYYYHIPRLTAAKIDMPAFLERGGRRLPGLAGVKYSDFTIYDLQACVDLEGGRYNILFGSDEMLLSGLTGGAQGAVGTSYNFALPLYRQVLAAFERGDIQGARRWQGRAVQMMHTLNSFGTPGNLPPMKAMMKLVGLNCGPLRLPLVGLGDEELGALREAMEAIGFFDWIGIGR